MRTAGAFQLVIEPETDTRPMRVSVALSAARADEQGMVQLTPACMSLNVLEGCINALQDELDMLRAEAREAFTMVMGHA